MKSKLAKKTTQTMLLPPSHYGSSIFDQYKNILDFYSKHPNLEFDKALLGGLALCTFFDHIDINYIERLIKQIATAMPHLIEVFRRPVTHLIEIETKVPVDTAKHITSKTVRHLMSHSEDWECIKNAKITPKNILTKTYDDDYSIYENIVFKNLVDRILKLLKKQLHYLNTALKIYNESVLIDAFSRINHSQYYSAIGTLYSGFFNNFKEIKTTSLQRKIKQELALITKYLSHPVYRKNINAKPISKDIKQTNILLMHKDYKYINWLWKELGCEEAEEEADVAVQTKAQRAYEKFCEYLLMFSVRHFNFDSQYKFDKWSVGIKEKKLGFVDLTAIELVIKHKKSDVKYLIVPISYYLGKTRHKVYEDIKKGIYDAFGDGYKQIIFCEPFETPKSDFILPISITMLDSFRHFQRLLLEGMILSDKDRKICAFCGEALTPNSCCKRCRLLVFDTECDRCNTIYTQTKIDGAKDELGFKTIDTACPNKTCCKENK